MTRTDKLSPVVKLVVTTYQSLQKKIYIDIILIKLVLTQHKS